MVLLNVLLETFPCIYSKIMFTIISFFEKLINGGWNKSGGGDLEDFQKLISRGEAIIRYSRVSYIFPVLEFLNIFLAI